MSWLIYSHGTNINVQLKGVYMYVKMYCKVFILTPPPILTRLIGQNILRGLNYDDVLMMRLQKTQQAAQLRCDMLHDNNVYMVGSCYVRLRIIHVSAVSEVGVLQRKPLMTAFATQQFSFKVKLPFRDTQAQSSHVSAANMLDSCKCSCCISRFLFSARLLHCSPTAYRIPCKRSLKYHRLKI